MNEYESDIRGWGWKAYRTDTLTDAIEVLLENSVEELSLFGLADSDSVTGRAYIGTVFVLTPSGKYYQPFACGNVEACSNCNGTGEIDNPLHSDYGELHTLYENKAQRLRAWLFENHGAWHNGDWPDYKQDDLKEFDRLTQRYAPTLTCSECGGLGSAEAYQDQLWQEALESVADDHNMYPTSAEGCSTDMFLARSVSHAEILQHLLDSVVDAIDNWLKKRITIRELKEVKRVARSVRNRLNELA